MASAVLDQIEKRSSGRAFLRKSWRMVQVRRMYRRLEDRISSLDWE